MKCLVTGGAGFIGINIALELERLGHDVVIIDNLFAGVQRNLIDFKGSFIELDVTDPKLLSISDKFDAIFHEAAITDPRYEDDNEVFRVNQEGFKNIIELAKRDKAKLVYASSASIYGAGNIPMKEDQMPDLQSAYAKSKFYMDEITYQLKDTLHIVGLRYFNVFGPRESHKGRPASMIYHLRRQMIEGKRPKLFKYGEQSRDQIYVKDVVKANLLALEAPSGIYNVGTGTGTTFNDIVHTLNNILNTSYEIDYIDNPYSGSYQENTLAEVTKSKSLLKFTPSYNFVDAVLDYHNYLLINGE